MIVYLASAIAVVAALRGMWSPCGLSMLTSLNPVSERARGNRYWGTVAWYVLGATVGGALFGAGCAAGAFGVGRLQVGEPTTWALVLAVAVVAVLSDSVLVPFALPDHPRQVDERWLVRYRRWIYAGGYGVQIGTGFATYIMTAGVYLTAALAVLTGEPAAAFGVGLGFGVVRGFAILLTSRVDTPGALRSLLARLDALDATSLRVACLAAAVVGVVAAWLLGGPIAGATAAIGLGLLGSPAPGGRLATRAALALGERGQRGALPGELPG
jgi:hypothetical protein